MAEEKIIFVKVPGTIVIFVNGCSETQYYYYECKCEIGKYWMVEPCLPGIPSNPTYNENLQKKCF